MAQRIFWPSASILFALGTVKNLKHMCSIFGCFKVPCPHNKYGGASSVVYGDVVANAAACECASCACRDCSFEGSPSELVRHLMDKAGRHAWRATKITYGTDVPFDINMKEVVDGRFLFLLFVAEEEDGGVFVLVLRQCNSKQVRTVNVVCLRSNADTGPVYSSTVAAGLRQNINFSFGSYFMTD